MDRALDSLSSDMLPVAMRVLARLVERGVPVLIVQTSRTMAEHQANLASGASATARSKHLPRYLRGFTPTDEADLDKADAIDLVPYDVFQSGGADKLAWSDTDNPTHQRMFAIIGEVGEAHGLRWGGRWKTPHDPGHLEWLFAGERYADIPSTAAAFPIHGVCRNVL